MSLPKRTADTMSDAIALSSPNGHMSKRAKGAAMKRLSQALFGDGSSCLKGEPCAQPTERERLLAHASSLRELAALGMNKRAYLREATKAEASAIALERNVYVTSE